MLHLISDELVSPAPSNRFESNQEAWHAQCLIMVDRRRGRARRARMATSNQGLRQVAAPSRRRQVYIFEVERNSSQHSVKCQKEFRGRHLLGPPKEVTGEYDRS